MEHTQVIIRPLVSEKATEQQEKFNEVCFVVAGGANKPMIKQAVENLYNVKVLDVRTLNRRGKPRRTRQGYTTTSAFKRAIVRLDAESKIELI